MTPGAKWVCVKTAGGKAGLIPKKCLRPFASRCICSSASSPPPPHTMDKDYITHDQEEEHTYADLANQTDLSLFSVSRSDTPRHCYQSNNNENSCSNDSFDSNSSKKTTESATTASYEFLSSLPSSSASTTQNAYESLGNFASLDSYDLLTSCQSTSRASNIAHYDVLMTYKSRRVTGAEDVYMNALTTTTPDTSRSKVPSLFRVVETYRADFRGDLSVNKGDLVYLMDQVASYSSAYSVSNSATKKTSAEGAEWAFVRLYKRTRKEEKPSAYVNVGASLQGFIPRRCLTKVKD